jgi:uncharacterized LabA/DUF88 family protein
MRTVVYIDGFNLYYSLLRRTNLKWLDVVTLFRDHVLDTNAQLVEVRYYTAPVLARMSDDPRSVQRQRIYLQALRKTHPQKLKIIEGRISVTTPFQRLVQPIKGSPEISRVQVLDFNEKKTDVSLASDLLAGAWTSAFEQAVLCSNDTDLEPALATLRRYHPHLRLGLVAPVKTSDSRHIAADLKKNSDWSKTLSSVHLANAQLPERIPASSLCRPEAWK